MRLDFFVAHATGLSRREVKYLINNGAITVEGEDRVLARFQLAKGQAVFHDGAQLHLPGQRYLMLNKPADTVSSTSDQDGTSVLQLLQLLPLEWRRDLHIVGRLDADSTGLLLLSSDGQWSHRITSPRSECAKVYLVTTARPVTEAMAQQLRDGILLRSEKEPTKPAEVELLSDHQLRLTISEGRYHQVKRMLAAVGNHVEQLHREQIGPLRLDESLALGQYRLLSEGEVALF